MNSVASIQTNIESVRAELNRFKYQAAWEQLVSTWNLYLDGTDRQLSETIAEGFRDTNADDVIDWLRLVSDVGEAVTAVEEASRIVWAAVGIFRQDWGEAIVRTNRLLEGRDNEVFSSADREMAGVSNFYWIIQQSGAPPQAQEIFGRSGKWDFSSGQPIWKRLAAASLGVVQDRALWSGFNQAQKDRRSALSISECTDQLRIKAQTILLRTLRLSGQHALVQLFQSMLLCPVVNRPEWEVRHAVEPIEALERLQPVKADLESLLEERFSAHEENEFLFELVELMASGSCPLWGRAFGLALVENFAGCSTDSPDFSELIYQCVASSSEARIASRLIAVVRILEANRRFHARQAVARIAAEKIIADASSSQVVRLHGGLSANGLSHSELASRSLQVLSDLFEMNSQEHILKAGTSLAGKFALAKAMQLIEMGDESCAGQVLQSYCDRFDDWVQAKSTSKDEQLKGLVLDKAVSIRATLLLTRLHLSKRKTHQAVEAIKAIVSIHEGHIDVSFVVKEAFKGEHLPEVTVDTYSTISSLLSAAGYSERAVAMLRVPVQADELHLFAEEGLFTVCMTPCLQLKYLVDCLRAVGDSYEHVDLFCENAVAFVTNIAYDDIVNGEDRKQFIELLGDLRAEILRVSPAWRSSSSTAARQLIFWVERLTHRILAEEYLQNQVEPRDATAEPIKVDLPQRHWGATGVWGNSPLSAEQIENWRKAVGAEAGLQLQHAVVNESDELNDERKRDTYSIGKVPDVLKSPENLEANMAELLGASGVWVRTLFAPDGRLHWWALTKSCNKRDELCVIANGKSETLGAEDRIRVANLVLDASIGAFWAAQQHATNDWLGELDPAGIFFPKSEASEKSYSFDSEQLNSNDRVAQAETVVSKLRKSGDASLLCVAKLAQELIDQSWPYQGEYQIALLRAWDNVLELLADKTRLESESIVQYRDRVLNNACKTHLGAIGYDFHLQELVEALGSDLFDRDLLFSVDGPLVAAPLEFFEVEPETHGKLPIFYFAKSISTTLSASLTCLPWANEIAIERQWQFANKKVLGAFWLGENERHLASGLKHLHAGLHSSLPSDWDVMTLVDSPQASQANIDWLLEKEKFDFLVIGGHGVTRAGRNESGIVTADQMLWSGSSRVRGLNAVIACACLVGRLDEVEDGGLRGLYTQLFVSGCPILVGARWSVYDNYAALFALEVASEFANLQTRDDQELRFSLAACVNDVRKKISREHPGSRHVISAFTSFGCADPRV